MNSENKLPEREVSSSSDLLASVHSKMIVAAAAHINKSLPVNYYHAKRVLHELGISTTSLAQTKSKKTVIVLRTDGSENVVRAFAC